MAPYVLVISLQMSVDGALYAGGFITEVGRLCLYKLLVYTKCALRFVMFFLLFYVLATSKVISGQGALCSGSYATNARRWHLFINVL